MKFSILDLIYMTFAIAGGLAVDPPVLAFITAIAFYAALVVGPVYFIAFFVARQQRVARNVDRNVDRSDRNPPNHLFQTHVAWLGRCLCWSAATFLIGFILLAAQTASLPPG